MMMIQYICFTTGTTTVMFYYYLFQMYYKLFWASLAIYPTFTKPSLCPFSSLEQKKKLQTLGSQYARKLGTSRAQFFQTILYDFTMYIIPLLTVQRNLFRI